MTVRADPRPGTQVRDRLHERACAGRRSAGRWSRSCRRTDGHVTGSELVERCRELDPTTTPSTVYRTLDVLEELGLVRHGHGADGREEFHVLPTADHGHLHCRACGSSWEISTGEADAIAGMLDAGRAFRVDRSHITISGRCAACTDGAPTP